MNLFTTITFLTLSLLILIAINYLFYKVISKNKRSSLKIVLSSALISGIISTLALDAFDVLYRIIEGLIKSGGSASKGIVDFIQFHYLPGFWIEEITLLFLIVIVVSLITTLIISKVKVHKN